MTNEPASSTGPVPIPNTEDGGPGRKAYRGLAMEGSIARWYAKTRGSKGQLDQWRQQAVDLTRDLPDGAEVLEVAPGPGYFSVELARLGRVRVSAIDVSRTFVEMVAARARAAGVEVSARLGDAAHLPFADGSFDRIVCQAAFKNFSRPQTAVNEMYRVLRPGGRATIEDMRRDAPDAAIRDEVRAMQLGRLRGFLTLRTLRSLRRRAYSAEEFGRFAARSPFRRSESVLTPIGIELSMWKPIPDAASAGRANQLGDPFEGRDGLGRLGRRSAVPVQPNGAQARPAGAEVVRLPAVADEEAVLGQAAGPA